MGIGLPRGSGSFNVGCGFELRHDKKNKDNQTRTRKIRRSFAEVPPKSRRSPTYLFVRGVVVAVVVLAEIYRGKRSSDGSNDKSQDQNQNQKQSQNQSQSKSKIKSRAEQEQLKNRSRARGGARAEEEQKEDADQVGPSACLVTTTEKGEC